MKIYTKNFHVIFEKIVCAFSKNFMKFLSKMFKMFMKVARKNF